MNEHGAVELLLWFECILERELKIIRVGLYLNFVNRLNEWNVTIER